MRRKVESGSCYFGATTTDNFKSCKQSTKTRLKLCVLKIHMQGSFSQRISSSDANAVLAVLDPRIAEYAATSKH